MPSEALSLALYSARARGCKVKISWQESIKIAEQQETEEEMRPQAARRLLLLCVSLTHVILSVISETGYGC